MKWSEEEIELLKKNYPLYGSDFQINRSKSSIIHKAVRLGLKANLEYKAKMVSKRLLGKPGKSCNLDFEQFKSPNLYSSYILGFLWGDGYLNKKNNNVLLQIITEDMIDIEYLFNKTGKWTKSLTQQKNRKQRTTLQTGGMQLYNLLSLFMYKEKSYISSTIQNTLDEDIKYYWWRGYFDADGCIYLNKKNNCVQLSIASTYEQDWNFLEELLIKLNCVYKIKRRTFITKVGKTNKSSSIRITNKTDILKFLDYIYQGEIFGLSRKYKKYLEVKDYISLNFKGRRNVNKLEKS